MIVNVLHLFNYFYQKWLSFDWIFVLCIWLKKYIEMSEGEQPQPED